MSRAELPQGWSRARLDEIVANIRGKALPSDYPELPFVGMEAVESQTMKLLGTVPSAEMKSAGVRFFPGDVLYGRLRPYLNKVLGVELEGLASAEFIPLTAERGVSSGFVRYRLNAADFVSFASHLDEGDRPRVDYGQIGAFECALPPTREQVRIVEAIERYFATLDDAAAALERVQRKLTRYRASVLKAAVEGRLVPTDAELAHCPVQAERMPPAPVAHLSSPSAFVGARASEYSQVGESARPVIDTLPAGWEWKTLREMKQFSLYGPRFSSEDYASEGRVVLRTSDITEEGRVVLEKAPRLRLEDEEFDRYSVRPGDLLITRTGSIGTLAVFNDTVDAIPGAYLIQYRLDAPTAVAWFVFYVLKSPRGQRLLLSGSAGVGRPNLNVHAIDAVVFGLPPLREVERILEATAGRLSSIERTEREVANQIARLARLRRSILKWAFEGKLVDQDASDEPASVLLECIKAERAASAPSPKPRAKKPRAKVTR